MDALSWMITVIAYALWGALFLVVVFVVLMCICGAIFGIACGMKEMWQEIQRLKRAHSNPLKYRLKQLKKLQKEVQAELKLAPSNTDLKSLLEVINEKIERYTTAGENFSTQQLAVESIRDKLRLVQVATEDEIAAHNKAVEELSVIESPTKRLRSIG